MARHHRIRGASVVIRGSVVPPVSSELCSAAQEAYELFVEIQRLDTADLLCGEALCGAGPTAPARPFRCHASSSIGPDPGFDTPSVCRLPRRSPAPNRRASTTEPQTNRGFVHQTLRRHDRGSGRTGGARGSPGAAVRVVRERRFLLSVKQSEPDWSLLPFKGLDRWPTIQWTLHNIRQMGARDHKRALDHLRNVLELRLPDRARTIR